ncbi:DUF2986 domain-containing protein [Shewanella gelidimarina]|uniref:DUF2986 domain-containing protein n=1 Tax=Shewanella gelidimarina TaxID=56813 RepID=UPI0020103508|nr:DUF2986 domain-containing protein [Shewanella gelidimarina]MCL1056399.1 DUF2986 domain-containing protein [Shewanella gelidimarina]
MNRTKKITKKFMGKAKKANSKLHTANKPKYVSKAERDRLEALEIAGKAIQEID